MDEEFNLDSEKGKNYGWAFDDSVPGGKQSMSQFSGTEIEIQQST